MSSENVTRLPAAGLDESLFAGVSHLDAWVEAVFYDGNYGAMHIHNHQVLRGERVTGQLSLEALRGIEA